MHQPQFTLAVNRVADVYSSDQLDRSIPIDPYIFEPAAVWLGALLTALFDCDTRWRISLEPSETDAEYTVTTSPEHVIVILRRLPERFSLVAIEDRALMLGYLVAALYVRHMEQISGKKHPRTDPARDMLLDALAQPPGRVARGRKRAWN
jgi:hypothetical protein